jgi:alanyl-tRNA synthetase
MHIKDFLLSLPKVYNKVSGMLEINGTVLGLFTNSTYTPYIIGKNMDFILISNATVFYAHGNGQEGDRGLIIGAHGVIKVNNTTKIEGVVLHHCKLLTGCVHVNEEIRLQVDCDWRLGVNKHHTATHILYGILRELFGGNIIRTGLLISNTYGRFECNLSKPLNTTEKALIEQKVREVITQDENVFTMEMEYDIAKAHGALHLTDRIDTSLVRCILVPYANIIVSHGTHVQNTKELKNFTIIRDEELSYGIRGIDITCM